MHLPSSLVLLSDAWDHHGPVLVITPKIQKAPEKGMKISWKLVSSIVYHCRVRPMECFEIRENPEASDVLLTSRRVLAFTAGTLST